MRDENFQRAVELLQQLGLKEYEAKCYASLTRLPRATAKNISEVSDVPRTRVYDAVRVLETMGLVEVQHTNPKQFRAVSPQEAAETLRRQYEERTESLVEAVSAMEPATGGDDAEAVTHEVWSLTGTDSIRNRMVELAREARNEVVLVVGRANAIDEGLAEQLVAAQHEGVDVVVGATSERVRDEIEGELDGIKVFTSGLEWLWNTSADDSDDVGINRLLLVDRETILVSTVDERGDEPEKAVFGRGFENGLVVVARRLMSSGLPAADDPGA